MYIRIKWIDDGVLNAFSAVASIRNDFRQRSNSNKEKSEMPVSFGALSGFVCVCALNSEIMFTLEIEWISRSIWFCGRSMQTHTKRDIQSTMLIGFSNQYYVWPQIKKIDDKKNGRIEIEIEIKSRVRQKRFPNRLFFNSFFLRTVGMCTESHLKLSNVNSGIHVTLNGNEMKGRNRTSQVKICTKL